MDLEKVLKNLVHQFNKDTIRYGLMGGYAVAIHGYPRSTVDLDFLVDRSDLAKVDNILHNMGYKIHFRSDNVSQFISDQELFGEIDFIHAFREASKRMLDQALSIKLFSNGPEIKVLRVEDIIGLKVQAIANAPHRKAQDFDDIKHLVAENYSSIDWTLVEEYFNLFQMKDLFFKIKNKSWQD